MDILSLLQGLSKKKDEESKKVRLKILNFLGVGSKKATEAVNNANYNLWHSPIGQAAINAQKFIESPKSINPIPQVQPYKQNNLPSQVGNFAANIPGMIGNSLASPILNLSSDLAQTVGRSISGQGAVPYQNLKSPISRLEYNALGVNRTPQQAIGNTAGVGADLLNYIIPGAGKKIITSGMEQIAKKGAGEVIKQGALSGAKYSGLYGLLTGISEGRNDTPVNQLIGGLQQGAIGAGAGVLLGGGASAAGVTIGKVTNELKNIIGNKYKKTPQEADQIIKQFVRDELGRFTGKKTDAIFDIPNMIPQQKQSLMQAQSPLYSPARGKLYSKSTVRLTDEMRSTIRTSLGLPDDGNYQKGFINMSAKVGGKPAVPPQQYKNAEDYVIKQAIRNGKTPQQTSEMFLSLEKVTGGKNDKYLRQLKIIGERQRLAPSKRDAEAVDLLRALNSKSTGKYGGEARYIRLIDKIKNEGINDENLAIIKSGNEEKISQMYNINPATVFPQAAIKLKVKGELKPVQAPQQITNVIEDIKAGFESGRRARETNKKGDLGLQARTQFIDKLSPIYDLLKKGKLENAPTEKNPYRQMRLLSGLSGKIEAFLDENLAPILKRELPRQNDLSALLVLDREKELIGNGFTRKRTIEQVNQGVQELQSKYGAEKFATLQQSANEIRNVGSKLLDELKTSGIIDDTSYQAIKQKNQFYAPFEAVSHIADNLEKGRVGSSFNVATQDVIKRIGDYTGEVADPLESLLRKIPKVIALSEKNKAMQAFVNLRNDIPDVYKDLIVPVKNETLHDKGIINVFENGKNVRYAVPDVVEAAIKNLDSETAGILGKIGGFQANILRTGATALNIGFIPTNIIRDVQDALTTEISERGVKSMLSFIASYPKAIFEAAKKGKLYQEWASSGGLQSTMIEQILKKPTKTLAELSGKRNTVKSVISSPRNLIEFANRVGEQSTRLARYKAGIQRGETPIEAAFKSRDISLDFSKSGNTIKVLNQVIPFLNAGIQGSEKLLRLYKNNPKAAVAATSVAFGLPTILLYNHNSQFKDYDDVPDGEKQTNWIIIARDRTDEEIAKNEKVIGIKIPKGFLGRMTSNTAEAAMDFMQKRDPSTFARSAYDTAAGISPIGLPINKESLGKTLSNVLPPWLKAGTEAVTNTNLFFGSSIVTQGLQNLPPGEQYRENTPAIYKLLGQTTGVSPLIAENTVNTTTGGLGRQIAGLLSGDLKGSTIGQITRRFGEIRGGKQADEAYKKVEKEKQYTANRNKQLKEAFKNRDKKEFLRLSKEMTIQQVKSLIRNDLKKTEAKKLTPVQRAYDTLSKEEKIRLGNERPELQKDLILTEQAGAAEPKPNTSDFFDSIIGEGSTTSLSGQTYERLAKLPSQEADKEIQRIAEENPALFTAIKSYAKDKKLGVTTEEKQIRSKGIQDGERAKAIVEEFKKLKSKQEKNKLFEAWVKKSIITPDVLPQLRKYRQQGLF